MQVTRGDRRDQDVLGAGGDQGRYPDLTEARGGVVAPDRVGLTREAVEPDGVGIGQRPLDPEADELGTLDHGLPAEDPGHDRPHVLLAVAARLHRDEGVDQEAAVGVDPCGRAVQPERPHAGRVPKGELLRDHAAHRGAADVRAPDPERVHQPDHVRGHPRDRVGRLRHVALAGAPVVERDHAMLGREGRRLQRPRGVVTAPAHDQHERRGVGCAGLLVEEADAVDLDVGHGAQDRTAASSSSSSVCVAASSVGAGGRTSAEAIQPRRRRISLRMPTAVPGVAPGWLS